MHRLLISLRKEWLLLIRDWHALLVLFAMPSIFVLVMSLALQDNFAGHQGLRLEGYIQRDDDSDLAQMFQQQIAQHPALNLTEVQEQPRTWGDYRFGVHIVPQFSRAFDRRGDAVKGVELRFAPEMGTRERLLVEAAAQEAFAYFNTYLLADEMGFDRDYAEQELLKLGFIASADDNIDAAERPNAVQQNVPAWLIFAMFFIAIPISTTLIQERNQKTLVRLRTLNTPVGIIFAGKLLPYLCINLIQLLLMLAIGAWVIPLLGGEALSLAVSLPGLLLISLSVSLAALGFASVVAAIARTVEQATVISGTCNILFAAVGGIMVPTFIMPPIMQELSELSPMAWGLEGYLEILLRGGTAASVLPACAVLIAFGLTALLLSTIMLRTEKHHD